MVVLFISKTGVNMRSHYWGHLNTAHLDQEVELCGWVHRRRDHGGVIFINLRDRDGITQAVFPEDAAAEVHSRAQLLRSEYVVAVEGKVEHRTPDTVNPNLATGGIEVVVDKIWILNESRTPPFPME